MASFSVKGQGGLRFGEASTEILSDFLTFLNNKNKSNLENVSALCGYFKNRRVVEHAVVMCEELQLDPLVAYQAIEILDRFMVKHIENLFSSHKEKAKETHEGLILQSLGEKFLVFLLSSVQIASKLAFHSSAIDNNSASRYLQSRGSSCPKKNLLESELLIMKTLNFELNVPNPLLYVETLLEVLGHNDPATPVAQLHHLCRYVLQFIYLQREPIYQCLLVAAAGCRSPSPEQRAKFVSVTEDCMLLGVGVITVSAFIYQPSAWQKAVIAHVVFRHNQPFIKKVSLRKQVVEELTLITGISTKSIMDFAHVTLMHITKNNAA